MNSSKETIYSYTLEPMVSVYSIDPTRMDVSASSMLSTHKTPNYNCFASGSVINWCNIKLV